MNWHAGFPLEILLVTLNDLECRNDRNFALNWGWRIWPEEIRNISLYEDECISIYVTHEYERQTDRQTDRQMGRPNSVTERALDDWDVWDLLTVKFLLQSSPE